MKEEIVDKKEDEASSSAVALDINRILTKDIRYAFIAVSYIIALHRFPTKDNPSNDRFSLNLLNNLSIFNKVSQQEQATISSLINISSSAVIKSIRTSLELNNQLPSLDLLRDICTKIGSELLLSNLIPLKGGKEDGQLHLVRYDARLRALLRILIHDFFDAFNDVSFVDDMVERSQPNHNNNIFKETNNIVFENELIDNNKLDIEKKRNDSIVNDEILDKLNNIFVETPAQKPADIIIPEEKTFYMNENHKNTSRIKRQKEEYENFRTESRLKSLILLETEFLISKKLWEEFNIKELVAPDDHTTPKVEQTEKNNTKKYLQIFGASIGGAVAIGLTGGLAAPLIGASLAGFSSTFGIGGAVATGSVFLSSLVGSVTVGTLFGVTGGSIAAFKLNRRFGELTEFSFYPIVNHVHSLNVIIAVSGWLSTHEDLYEPWLCIPAFAPWSESDALVFDSNEMLELGSAMKTFLSDTVVSVATIFSSIVSALIWPVGLLQLSYLIDNPWAVAMDRSEKAGSALAREVIYKHVHGARPVTLVAWSVGSKVIYHCLSELSKLKAYGFVDSVYFIGTPVSFLADGDGDGDGGYLEWENIRRVVAGRIVNGFSSNDWLLGFLCRDFLGGSRRVMGLGPVVFEGRGGLGIENVDLIPGHLKYKELLPDILERVGFERDGAARVMPPKRVNELLFEAPDED